MKIGIIGGGASGIAASIEAAESGGEVIVLERTGSVLNKFILSGAKRCNISNENLSEAFYNGGSRHFIAKVLKAYGKERILELLKKIGCSYTIEEDGRIFTGDSENTAQRLLKYTASLGTQIRLKTFVEKIESTGDGFILKYKNKEEIFDRIIITTGGKSYPSTGSDGYGYLLAESLGHTIIKPLPGLTPLFLRPNPFSGLQGISIPASMLLENKRLEVEVQKEGPLLFTHKGISGPLCLNMSSSFIRIQREKGTHLFLCLLPEFKKEEFERELQDEINRSGKKKLVNFLSRFLPDRLAERVVKIAEIPEDRKLAELKREERKGLLEVLFRLEINVSGSPGFSSAHVTTGGVSLEEVNPSTMESRVKKGLFFAGEILDVDGLEGGYNLHWAFATGYIAGKNASIIS